MTKQRSPRAYAAHGLYPPHLVVDDTTIATKLGEPFCVLRFTGPDSECLEPNARESARQTFLAAMQTLPTDLQTITWFQKTAAQDPARPEVEHPVARELAVRRADALKARRLSDIDTYIFLLWRSAEASYRRRSAASELLYNPVEWLRVRFSPSARTERYFAELEKATRRLKAASEAFVQRFDDRFRLELLSANEAFSVLARHLTPNGAKALARPAPEELLDYQLGASHVEWHRDHLAIDEKRVAVLSLRHPPAQTFVDMLRDMQRISGRWTVVTDCKRVPEDRASMELKLRHLQLRSKATRVSVLAALGNDKGSTETFRNVPAHAQIAELEECEREILEGKYLCDFSIKVVFWTDSKEEEHDLAGQFMRLFTRMDGQLVEERLGLLPEYLDTVPGNYAYGSRRLLLLNTNVADLAPVFSVDTGEVQNVHLHASCLTTVETNERTPFHLNLHVGDIASTLIFGRPGSGKTFFAQHLIAACLQYRPQLYIFDVAGSYEHLTRALGGAYFRLSLDQQPFTLNPFAGAFSKDQWVRLIDFVSILVERPGFSMNAEQKNRLGESIKNIFQLDPELRRLSTLASILPHDLQRQLAPWIDDGPYARLFDNAHDSFYDSDFQCFDLSAMREQRELLSPLVYLIHTRIEDAVTAPAKRDRPKFLFSDETWFLLDHPAFVGFYRDVVKRWRRYNGSIVLATQSSDDLSKSEILQAVLENCPSKIFLASPDIDENVYGSLFHLNSTELSLLKGLQPKRQLLLKQSHRSKVLNFTTEPMSTWLFTTTPLDAKRRDEAIAIHGLEKALEEFLGEKHR